MMKIVLLSLAMCIALIAVDGRKHKKVKGFRNNGQVNYRKGGDSGGFLAREDETKPEACTADPTDNCVDNMSPPSDGDDGDECVDVKTEGAVRKSGCKKATGDAGTTDTPGEAVEARCVCEKDAVVPNAGEVKDVRCSAGEDDQCPIMMDPNKGDPACTVKLEDAVTLIKDCIISEDGACKCQENDAGATSSFRKLAGKKEKKVVQMKQAEKRTEQKEMPERAEGCTGFGCDDAKEETATTKAVKNKQMKSKKHKSIKKQTKKNNQ